MRPMIRNLLKVKYIFALLMLPVIISCSKEKAECFDVYTNNGSMSKTVCDLTETLIQNVYGQYYDRTDAPKYCWKATYLSDFVFAKDLSEKMAGIFFSDAQNLQKVPCDYCQVWRYTKKSTYKPTGSDYTRGGGVQMLCGDTCSTLYRWREVIVGETVDSIFKVVFTERLE